MSDEGLKLYSVTDLSGKFDKPIYVPGIDTEDALRRFHGQLANAIGWLEKEASKVNNQRLELIKLLYGQAKDLEKIGFFAEEVIVDDYRISLSKLER